jgi:hypothetical protein
MISLCREVVLGKGDVDPEVVLLFVAVDALGVDLQEHVDGVPCPLGDVRCRHALR